MDAAARTGDEVARASMGPRPLGRGWAKHAAATDAVKAASMGPRPLGRGWRIPQGVRWEMGDGFNGAATARSRMVVGSAASRLTVTCFNGAATARSRMALLRVRRRRR